MINRAFWIGWTIGVVGAILGVLIGHNLSKEHPRPDYNFLTRVATACGGAHARGVGPGNYFLKKNGLVQVSCDDNRFVVVQK